MNLDVPMLIFDPANWDHPFAELEGGGMGSYMSGLPSCPGAPPSPPASRFHSLGAHLAELNMRFHREPWDRAVTWRADGRLGEGGVLLHCFDSYEDPGSIWVVAERGGGDTSASIIYAAMGYPGSGDIPVFDNCVGGLIYEPILAIVKCGKASDSGGHCPTVFCPSVQNLGDVSTYQFPGDGCGGAWQPKDFALYLHRHSEWQRLNRRL